MKPHPVPEFDFDGLTEVVDKLLETQNYVIDFEGCIYYKIESGNLVVLPAARRRYDDNRAWPNTADFREALHKAGYYI